MSSKKKSPSESSYSRARRPILWIGGRGLPRGSAGTQLVALGHPLHWEPPSKKAASTVASLQPVLVVIESEKIAGSLKDFLFTLGELRTTIDMVVFQVRRKAPRHGVSGIDGTLLRGAGLVQQIKTVLATMDGNGSFKAAGVRAQKKLANAKAELTRLRTLAVRDDLTCLYNLRFFNRSLETEHQRATRFGRCYSLIFLDLPARIGGDEFVVICPETTKPAARLVADRLRYGIQRLQDAQGKSLGITASIGVASFPDDGDLPDDVLQRTDRALYEAKALGKNRVCCWGEFVVEGDDKSFLGSVHNTDDATPLQEPKKKPTVN